MGKGVRVGQRTLALVPTPILIPDGFFLVSPCVTLSLFLLGSPKVETLRWSHTCSPCSAHPRTALHTHTQHNTLLRAIHSLCTDHVELRFRVHTCTGVIGPEARCTQSVHCLFRDAWC